MIIPNPRKLKSGTWFIQLRLGGESIPVSARTKKDCQKQAQLIKAEYLAGKREKRWAEAEKPKAPTLGEAIDAYIEKRDAVLSPVTIRGYRIIQKNRFKSTMGRKLSEIKPQEWQTICNDESRICRPKTLKNAWGFISSVVYEATGEKPPKVKLPQIVQNERPFLEPEQIRLFIEAVHGTNTEIPALLALSSLRKSEIFALRWENIDLKKRIIKVRGAAVIDEHGRLVQKAENKNRTSNRNVPIMMDELYKALCAVPEKSGLVVTCAQNTIYRQVNQICERSGLPKVGVHGLRHSFVSLAYHLHVPEKIVMEIGGWADYQTMRRIYTHIARSDVARYTEYFEGVFSEEAGPADESPSAHSPTF